MALLLLGFTPLTAQNDGLQRSVSLQVNQHILIEDSLTIVPESVYAIHLPSEEEIGHCIRVENNTLYWKEEDCKEFFGDSIFIRYRSFHFDLGSAYLHLDSAQLQAATDDGETYIGFDFSPFESEHADASFRNLNYAGSFSRGLTVGNSQSLVLNSSFNMQMSGTLGDDINVMAVISDENIPIQADGSTRQIQEFDRIFIELSRNQHRLLAGDIELRQEGGHFMRYHKKLKGLNYGYEDYLGNGVLQTEVGASISQGKFARQRLEVSEGNQGPYRLRGSSGERFIIVLAGTESIFLDGRKLIRGIENDYIIDYNTAEIIFTYNTMVTKDSRIIAEFEFIDQNYSRSLLTLNSRYRMENTEFYLNFYSEQDSRSPTGLLDLSREDIELLERAGDETENLYSPALIPVEDGFNPNQVQYEQQEFPWKIEGRDTVFQILVVAEGPAQELFTAQFTDLGQGQGNYIRRTDARNGRVYEFVPPDSVSGARQGRFEPVRRLTPPQKQQMTSVGVRHRFSQNTHLSAEVSISNFDDNRFSEIGNRNNAGVGTFLQFNTERALGSDSLPWTIYHQFDYEFSGENFRVLNPYRSPEFERDWNYIDEQPQNEHWGTGILGLSKGNHFDLSYEFSGLFRADEYRGTRNLIAGAWQFEKMEIDGEANWLRTKNIHQTTRFSRPILNLKRRLDFLPGGAIGYRYEEEQNEFLQNGSDSLDASSFRFQAHTFFVEQAVQSRLNWRASYTSRTDDRPEEGSFTRFTQSENWKLSGSYSPADNHEIKASVNLRELEVTEAGIDDFQARKTLLSRLEYSGRVLNGALTYGNVYEAGSGQEPKVEFEFREVPPGEGQYTWIDLNGDGKQQINEFFLTPNPEERTHIRLPIITDEFISVNSVSIHQNLSWNPARLDWGDSELAAMARRFSLVSNLRVDRRTVEEDRAGEFNPYKWDPRDTTLVSFNLGTRHSLFFNRGHATYDIQLSYLHNTTTNEQVTGSEGRANSDWTLRGRYNISRSYTHIVQLSTRTIDGFSDAFLTNNFEIRGWEVRSEGNYRFSQSLNLKAWYAFQQKSNVADGALESGKFHDITTEWTFRQEGSSSVVSARLNYTRANVEGPLNSPAAILMLTGLSPGSNLRANISFEKRVTENLRLSLQYTGRKPGSNAFVHTGSMNATATF